MRRNLLMTCLFAAIFFLLPIYSQAENDKSDDFLVAVTDYTSRITPGESPQKYEALAMFGAKYKAVVLAAKYLSHKDLLEDYGKKQKEIFCLTADELEPTVIEKKILEKGGAFFIKIRTKVSSIDFIRAQIKDLQLEKSERKFSLHDKMEQQVYKSIDPALELSRAYRYIRKMQWRIAVIYLEHLEKKYPNWSEIYLAKAIAFYAIHEIPSMMAALRTSCLLGNREACEDIEGLHAHEKGLKPNPD